MAAVVKSTGRMSRTRTSAKTGIRRPQRPQRKAPRPTASFFAGHKRYVALSLLLAAATIALYSPAINSSFIGWDADDLVTGNPHIQGGISWNAIAWAFTSTQAWNWFPLTWLSHALDYQIFASNPGGHHFDSVLLHALNAVLLFLMLAWATKRLTPSLLVAALFAVHPINVQSVVWVTERKDVLSTFFFLLAIIAYLWYAREPDWRRFLLVTGLFVAGLMSKPMVITLPFILLLLDFWPLERIQLDRDPSSPLRQAALYKLVLEKVLLFALSIVSAVVTVKVQGHAVRNLQQFPFAIRIENAIVSYGLYLWKMLWPARLALFYPHPATLLPKWQLAISMSVLIGITVLVLRFRRRRYLVVGWFWFLITLVPVIGLVQVGAQAMADRYAYLPLIGIFLMIAFGLCDLAQARDVPLAWQVVPALCVLTALGVVTSRQLTYWKNDYTIWAHTLAVTEHNVYAHDALAAALMDPAMASTASELDGLDTEQKRVDEARRHWTLALELNTQALLQHPDDPPSQDMAMELNNLGFLDRLQNRLEEARTNYGQALSIYSQIAQHQPAVPIPDMAMTLNHLGLVEKRLQRLDEARQHDEEALVIEQQLAKQDPGTYQSEVAGTLVNLGNLDILQNRLDEGRQHYEQAASIYSLLSEQDPTTYLPNLATALNNLVSLDRLQNRTQDERQHLEALLRAYQQLAERDPSRYAHEVTQAEATLAELANRTSSR